MIEATKYAGKGNKTVRKIIKKSKTFFEKWKYNEKCLFSFNEMENGISIWKK